MESERQWREGAEERREAFQQKKAEQQQVPTHPLLPLSLFPHSRPSWKE